MCVHTHRDHFHVGAPALENSLATFNSMQLSQKYLKFIPLMFKTDLEHAPTKLHFRCNLVLRIYSTQCRTLERL